MALLQGFERSAIKTSGATINYVAAGVGEPILLLHGYPETHVCWHRIAPALAKRYRVICADLRGYGDSSKPEGLPDHSNYSKRTMGLEIIELIRTLGHHSFHLVGHDRGARVAHRLTRDHEASVRTLTVLDVSPTLKMFESTNLAFATAYYHWFLMLQPPPLPEKMLAGQVPFNILGRVGREEPDLTAFDPEAIDAYVRAFADPRAIHASCEDYRAAGTIDLEHDRADRGRKIDTPVLALWGARAVVGKMFDCLADWREVANKVTGHAIDCGHFLPEEAPQETLAEIERFIASYEAEVAA
jgi:haloacetate dehalogenase